MFICQQDNNSKHKTTSTQDSPRPLSTRYILRQGLLFTHRTHEPRKTFKHFCINETLRCQDPYHDHGLKAGRLVNFYRRPQLHFDLKGFIRVLNLVKIVNKCL